MSPNFKTGSMQISFIDKCIEKIAGLIKSFFLFECSSRNGFFQRLDSRVKISFMIFFLIIVSVKKDIQSEAMIFCFIFLCTIISKIDILNFYKRTFFFAFIFGFLIALPSSLNIITDGRIILHLMRFESAKVFWIYHIPAEIGITKEGFTGVVLLTLRVLNSLSLSLLVIYTTMFSEIIRALKILKIPDTFLMILSITYKYIFIFAKTVEDIYLSMKSRITGQLSRKEIRYLIAGRMAFIFKKSRITCEEVYSAMISRGFSNDLKIFNFNKMQTTDWFACICFCITGVIILLN